MIGNRAVETTVEVAWGIASTVEDAKAGIDSTALAVTSVVYFSVELTVSL